MGLPRELEVKFYQPDLTRIEQTLLAQQASLVQPRTFEINLRFDTPDQRLTKGMQVLRLRQDTAVRLTYKGPGINRNGVLERTEIEFTAGDFDQAKAFLEALGYRVSMVYEKYRQVYEFRGVLVTLDEMPYGNFIEIEGPDAPAIHRSSQILGLDWASRVSSSYASLFTQLQHKLGLAFRDLTFENFTNLAISAEDLGVSAGSSTAP